MTEWVDYKEIKASVSIQQILDYYGITNLKRSGNKLHGPCPVHGGDNPRAFHVDLDRNIWNCFTKCRGGGNVLDFVARKEGVDIREAALLIQKRFLSGKSSDSGERVPKEVEKKSSIVNLTDINPPLNLRLNLMHDHPYLLNERGLAMETIMHFGIGYCSAGTMRGHIAIPIHNENGKLVAYAGRRVNGDGPKYKFPKGFQKQYALFNYHRAKEHLENGLTLVEGFFDVFKAYQAGYPNVVALMGSSASPYQLNLLVNAQKLTLFFDGDEAGRVCTEEIANRLKEKIPMEIIKLDEEVQPDLLSVEAIQHYLK